MVSEQSITEEINLLVGYYPRLSFAGREGQFWVVEGEFDLRDNAGDYWDTFSIRIQIPNNYPEALPQIIETGVKIPEEMDWHNSSLGCCLSPDAVIYQRLSRVNLYDWFREFVVSYFANFLYKKNFGEYPKGEFEHMSAGIMRGYSDLFNLSSKEEILNFIKCQIARLKTGRNNKCYCGSDVKFKFCGFVNSPLHRDIVRIPLHVLQSDLLKIMRPSND